MEELRQLFKSMMASGADAALIKDLVSESIEGSLTPSYIVSEVSSVRSCKRSASRLVRGSLKRQQTN